MDDNIWNPSRPWSKRPTNERRTKEKTRFSFDFLLISQIVHLLSSMSVQLKSSTAMLRTVYARMSPVTSDKLLLGNSVRQIIKVLKSSPSDEAVIQISLTLNDCLEMNCKDSSWIWGSNVWLSEEGVVHKWRHGLRGGANILWGHYRSLCIKQRKIDQG